MKLELLKSVVREATVSVTFAIEGVVSLVIVPITVGTSDHVISTEIVKATREWATLPSSKYDGWKGLQQVCQAISRACLPLAAEPDECALRALLCFDPEPEQRQEAEKNLWLEPLEIAS